MCVFFAFGAGVFFRRTCVDALGTVRQGQAKLFFVGRFGSGALTRPVFFVCGPCCILKCLTDKVVSNSETMGMLRCRKPPYLMRCKTHHAFAVPPRMEGWQRVFHPRNGVPFCGSSYNDVTSLLHEGMFWMGQFLSS